MTHKKKAHMKEKHKMEPVELMGKKDKPKDMKAKKAHKGK